jgi:hypothetical protein
MSGAQNKAFLFGFLSDSGQQIADCPHARGGRLDQRFGNLVQEVREVSTFRPSLVFPTGRLVELQTLLLMCARRSAPAFKRLLGLLKGSQEGVQTICARSSENVTTVCTRAK